jgi:hypothetical protein
MAPRNQIAASRTNESSST